MSESDVVRLLALSQWALIFIMGLRQHSARGLFLGLNSMVICISLLLPFLRFGELEPWYFFLNGIAALHPFLLWIYAMAIFRDDFLPKLQHALLGFTLMCLETMGFGARSLLKKDLFADLPFGFAMNLQGLPTALSFGFILLAAYETLRHQRQDLWSLRFRSRPWFAAGFCLWATVYTWDKAGAVALIAADDRPAGIYLPLGLFMTALLINLSQDRQNRFWIDEVRPLAPGRDAPRSLVAVRFEKMMSTEKIYQEKDFSLASLAKKLNMPAAQMRDFLFQTYGHGHFDSLASEYRIQEAKKILLDPKQSDKDLQAIATLVGFPNAKAFSRAFQRVEQTTPLSYRQAALTTESNPSP